MGFEFNQETHAYSIHDIYESRNVKKYPVTAEISLVVYWDGIVGETFDLSFTIIDSNGKIITDLPAERVIIGSRNHIVFQVFKGVVFRNPGTYSININVGGICVDTVPYILTNE
jgi:hypothetical protein